jgi:hypothetical protein
VSREVIKLNEIMMLLLHNIFPAAYVPRVLQGDSSIAERSSPIPPLPLRGSFPVCYIHLSLALWRRGVRFTSKKYSLSPDNTK